MKTIKSYLTAGFFFCSILGTLAHFFYEWSGYNIIVGMFSPISESCWEHMKLTFFPPIVWSLLMPSSLENQRPALRSAVLVGTLSGTAAVPVLFYTYSGIIGKNFAPADIAIFYFCVALIFLIAWKIRDQKKLCVLKPYIYFAAVSAAVLFFLFTLFPPNTGIFAVP